METVLQDVRFAVRQLRKRLGFTTTAVLTVGLGMCASVAIFAFVDAALLKPLPYPQPSRLVGVYERVPMFPQSNLSYLDYLDWKRMNDVFTTLAAYQASGVAVSTADGVERAPGARVSDDFFRTLGVTPVLGRDFQPGEDLPSSARSVILSQAAWQKRYGGQADVLGRTVTLNGEPHVIVGVLPADFHFAPVEPAEFWATLHATGSCDRRRSCHNLYGVARLRDGVSVEAAAAEMVSIAAQLETQYPDSNRGQGAAVVALTDVIVGNVRPILLVLLGGAALLMLIASVNVASLLLVRSESRAREIAVRRALGASPTRVFRQFVTEGVILVALGSVLGIVAAYWTAALLISLIPTNLATRMPYLHDLGPNARVAGFAAMLALAAAALFALTPMVHVSFSKTREGLADGTRGSSGLAWRRLGSKLIVVELATAVVLLVGAGLLGKSFYRLLHVDIGLQPDNLVMLGVSAPVSPTATNEQRVAFAEHLQNRIGALPGVRATGVASTPPLQGGNTVWVRVDGRPYNGEHNEVLYREVSHTYFSTLGARLLRGRAFTAADDASAPPVIVVNQALVRRYFPGEDPLGQRILYAPTTTQPAMEIVGVVDDIKEGAMDAPAAPAMYVAFAQDPTFSFALVVRATQPPQTLLPTMVAAIHEIDPTISTFNGRPMRDVINTSPSAYVRRSSASLVGGFAVAAWLLSVIGLYGVVAYSVSQRTREIGVRMALGAERRSVYRLILREAVRLTSVGVAIGLLCAVAAATLMSDLLFGVRSWDLSTLAAVAGGLGVSALAATFFPAQRAASINPVEALRAE